MLAVASGQLLQLHQATNLVGRLYNISHFQVEDDPNDYLRYEGYAFIRSPYFIKINPNTRFIFLGPCIERLFPTHPWVSSIEALARNEREKNMIDVVGKIVGGGRYGRRNYVCEMILQDRSGYVISLILFYDPQITPFMAARAIQENLIIYVSRCKLVTRIGRMNYLNSTPLTRIEYNPIMPEAEAIRELYG